MHQRIEEEIKKEDELIVGKRPKPVLINIFKKIYIKDDYIYVKAFGLYKLINGKNEKIDLQDLKIKIDQKAYDITIKRLSPYIKGFTFVTYSFKMPTKEVMLFDMQNKLIVNYKEKYQGRIIYTIFDYKKGKYRNTKPFITENTAIFFRQTLKNTMYLTVREKTQYDYPKDNFRVNLAWLLAKVYPKVNLKLLYEKESSRYEESASTLYERLIDKGYKNCYYIINKDNPMISNISEKYKKNLIYKNSLKHLIYFFKCNTFIATETIGHALQLRIANKHAVKKINSPKNKFIFLQHGVMYMISLNSELRSGFRNNQYKLYRVVVSSQLEAKHFIDLGGFQKKDLYITGLAKFDHSVKNENANKIVIMPTWRRWESNLAREDFTKTKYYQMIKRIVASIPDKWKDNIVVLPHPLMINAMKNASCELEKYLPSEIMYNEILKDCKLLITDYSSVSYDAFYRGSNVIFYWEEKEECLKEYGEEATLMLTEDLAFGYVCYSPEELKNIIVSAYTEEQTTEMKKNYEKIVEFKDNKNTDRIIEYLKEDKVI